MAATPNADAIATFVTSAQGRNFPDEAIESAKRCLVDWFGVAIGGSAEPAAQSTRAVAAGWGTTGDALLVSGGTMAPAAAALVNGTMAHCLDYDDTHVGSTTHIGGPTIAAALAVATDRGLDERQLLAAVIAGFETAARLGRGVGQPSNMRGFHATGVFGAFGAATAASVSLGLDAAAVRNAIGAAATQTGGLTGSFGTMAKPSKCSAKLMTILFTRASTSP